MVSNREKPQVIYDFSGSQTGKNGTFPDVTYSHSIVPMEMLPLPVTIF